MRPVIDVSGLPDHAFGHRSILWWGTLGFVATEATAFGLAVMTYFYLRHKAPSWPPNLPPPNMLWGTVNLAILLASCAPNAWVKAAAEREALLEAGLTGGSVHELRAVVPNRPGVIADIAAALRDEHVSMEAMIQRGRAPGEAVPVVLTTHVTEEAAMRRALDRIGQLDTVLEPPRMIRIENL
jgi:hypothetical protein